MKCLERMLFKLAAIVIIACCGCKTTHSATSETHLSEATETHSEGGTVVTTTTTQGPETITTVTEEFESGGSLPDALPPAALGDGSTSSTSHASGRGADRSVAGSAGANSSATSVPPHGALVKRTTVTDVRGPSLSESHFDAHTASETHVETKVAAKATSESKSAPAASCAFGGMLWALAVIGLALAAFAAVRKRMF